jgi:hypothetical protein
VTRCRSPPSAVGRVEEPTAFVVDDDESFHVGGDGRADIPPLEPGCLALGHRALRRRRDRHVKVSTGPDRQRYINADASHAKADAFQTRCA